MTTPTLPLREHVELAPEFLEEAEAEFAAGKPLKGAEMLWGAVAHALTAVALQNGWPHDSHGSLKRVAKRLPNVPGASHWLTEFDVMEWFHSHFYHGQMSDRRIAQYRPRARRLVNRLLAVAQPADG
ncbi:MAG: hypothetical protein F4X64_01055 [Chloroflexi bacterium]|nr:hypothetical protein [Chloroflexota bacterium]